jgi:hypothetical protein
MSAKEVEGVGHRKNECEEEGGREGSYFTRGRKHRKN